MAASYQLSGAIGTVYRNKTIDSVQRLASGKYRNSYSCDAIVTWPKEQPHLLGYNAYSQSDSPAWVFKSCRVVQLISLTDRGSYKETWTLSKGDGSPPDDFTRNNYASAVWTGPMGQDATWCLKKGSRDGDHYHQFYGLTWVEEADTPAVPVMHDQIATFSVPVPSEVVNFVNAYRQLGHLASQYLVLDIRNPYAVGAYVDGPINMPVPVSEHIRVIANPSRPQAPAADPKAAPPKAAAAAALPAPAIALPGPGAPAPVAPLAIVPFVPLPAAGPPVGPKAKAKAAVVFGPAPKAKAKVGPYPAR